MGRYKTVFLILTFWLVPVLLFSGCDPGQVTTTAIISSTSTVTQTQTMPPATVTQTSPPTTVTQTLAPPTVTTTITQTVTPPPIEPTYIAGDISPAQARDMMQNDDTNQELIVIDVRTPEEHAEGYIEGSALIDFRSDTWQATVQALDRSKAYILY